MDTSRPAAANSGPLSREDPAARLEHLIESPFAEDLIVAAAHGSLTEDLALAMLRRSDLPATAIEALNRNQLVLKHRKVLLQLIQHPHTPRHISLPMLRRLFTFELMDVALASVVAADVKQVAEELLIGKLKTISLGERIALARRASAGVAGVLLLHAQGAVIQAALENPRMTESSIMKSLAKPATPLLLLTMLAANPKWSLRRDIQIGILRRSEASEALVYQVAAKLPKPAIYELLKHASLPAGRRELLQRVLLQR
ncbi:MAG TPA: hypothetical protein VJ453_08225 [Terriglobales bacterium]|nr:hypothetical protein [Terriglobales bacterium]